MQMHRLYHYPLSPFCRKIRLVLAEKKIEVELVEEKYWEQSAEFLRRNPAGKVPVLRIENEILTESSAICEYLEDLYPEPALMPRDAKQRYEVRRLVSWFDDKFHSEVTQNLLYERVHKKITGQGFPDSKNVKLGSKRIKFHHACARPAPRARGFAGAPGSARPAIQTGPAPAGPENRCAAR